MLVTRKLIFCKMWCEDVKMSFEEKLISLIKAKELLYNTKSRSYKNIVKRYSAWTNIAKELDRPVEECRQRWKSLRDRFVREKRKLERLSDSGTEDPEMWDLYPLLEFLSDYLRPRMQIGNLQPLFDENSGNSVGVISTPEVPSSDETPTAPKRTRISHNDFAMDEFFVNVSHTDPDDNDLFLKMIGQKMKGLPQEAKIRLQEKMLKEVHEEILKNLKNKGKD